MGKGKSDQEQSAQTASDKNDEMTRYTNNKQQTRHRDTNNITISVTAVLAERSWLWRLDLDGDL